MNETAFRAFPADGVVALYDEAPGGGDVLDINSLRNRPAKTPEDWLANIYLHSALDNMEVAFDSVVTVSHLSIAAASNGTGIELNSAFDFDAGLTDWEALTHSLGYPPLVMVAIGDVILMPGQPVQGPGVSGGTVRYVSHYVTDTKVYIREFASRGTGTLSAIDVDYRILVFKRPPDPIGDKLVEFDPDTGAFRLALNRFDSTRRYLQVVPMGTPFFLPLGRTMDAANGAPRLVGSDGAIVDPIPNAVKMGIKGSSEASVTYGASMDYNGTFAGDGSIEVQAP